MWKRKYTLCQFCCGVAGVFGINLHPDSHVDVTYWGGAAPAAFRVWGVELYWLFSCIPTRYLQVNGAVAPRVPTLMRNEKGACSSQPVQVNKAPKQLKAAPLRLQSSSSSDSSSSQTSTLSFQPSFLSSVLFPSGCVSLFTKPRSVIRALPRAACVWLKKCKVTN